jgi:protein arginine kinase
MTVRLPEWTRGNGPEPDVVLASRIRLARNVRGLPFPHQMTDDQGRALLETVTLAVRRIEREWHLTIERLRDLTPLDRQFLVETHLVSPLLVSEPIRQQAVIMDERQSISVMVGEEDHLRIQVLMPGLELSEAWNVANRLDDALEQGLDYAYDRRLGYLTAFPTNVGTGLRASVMVHLPALVLTRQAPAVFTALSQMGMVVRGLYGEGTEAQGSIFQISNQVSLGRSEEELVHSLTMVAEQVVGRERLARQQLDRNAAVFVADRVGRAFGILRHCRILSSDEALRLLSEVHLGIELGRLPPFADATFSQLVSMTRPAVLQKMAGRELDPGARDTLRAEVIQQHLKHA